MPIKIMKGSLDYLLKNKLFFLFVFLLFFILEIIFEIFEGLFVTPFIFLFVIAGYGLQVTHDVINGGVRLPKILPKKIIAYGVKGFAVLFFYFFIQGFVMFFITDYLHFPDFDVEDLFLHFSETMHLFQSHDLISFIIFIVSGFLIFYVTTFFMELALAKLADESSLKETFNFRKIKHAIDIIGWREYAIDYSKILFSIILLLYINEFSVSFAYIDILIGTITDLLMFVIEYRGIGLIYMTYKDKKKAIAETHG